MLKTDILTGLTRLQLANAVMLAFIVAVVMCANVAGATCNHLQTKEFVLALNKELRLVSYWEKITRSPVICVSYCHSDPNCQSVNYHTSSHLCQLNNATRAQYPDDFITHYGSWYFDANEDSGFASVPSQDPTKQPAKSLSHTPDQATSLKTDTPFLTGPDLQAIPQLNTPVSSTQLHAECCTKLLEAGYNTSGIYKIFPSGFSDGVRVYCDMDTNEGGWIVIQRRKDGSVDFNRNWVDYKEGFGNLSGEFWLGNDIIKTLTTSNGPWRLRIDVGDWDHRSAWSEYSDFSIGGSSYVLRFTDYNSESTAGDSLSYHKGYPFSTKDYIYIYMCAQKYHGGWWFDSCHQSLLNGVYYQEGSALIAGHGIQWDAWREDPYSLKTCSMKIRM